MVEASVTFAEFARMLRVKPTAVTALRHAGRLVLTENGKGVRVTESYERLRETADPSKAGVVARHAAERARKEGQSAPITPDAPHAPTQGDEDDEPGEEESIGGYQSSRARREHYLALAAQRDYELSIGKLVDSDDVDAAVASAVVTLRNGLERLPDVLSAQLAAITDEASIRALLAEAIEHALEEMARQFHVMAKQVDA